MALSGPGALVRHAKERRDILDVVGGEHLQHLLIPHSLVKWNHNRSIGDKRNGVVNLGEPLDEGVQGFHWALLDSMEVGLVARSSIGTLDVGHELAAQVRPGVEGPLGQVQEPRLGHSSQGNMEVVGHNGLIRSCHKDRGGVDLQELSGFAGPVILLQQVGP
jgi:hypothetical protein